MEELTTPHQKPKYIYRLFGLFLIVLIIFLAAEARNVLRKYAYIGKSEQMPYTITISGEGKVTAIPDIATFSIGVITEKKEVGAAQTENTKKMNEIIDELKKIGIDKEDIKTNYYNISPQYDWLEKGRQVLRGYQVNQTVTVKVRDLDRVGEVLGKAGTLGANNVSGLNFTIDEPEKLRQQAREEALLAAKKKAEALAKVAGVKLGKLVTFSETSPISYPRYDYVLEAKAMGAGAETPEIEPGSLEITVDVTVSYEVL